MALLRARYHFRRVWHATDFSSNSGGKFKYLLLNEHRPWPKGTKVFAPLFSKSGHLLL
jgi:hypothetical protein